MTAISGNSINPFVLTASAQFTTTTLAVVETQNAPAVLEAPVQNPVQPQELATGNPLAVLDNFYMPTNITFVSDAGRAQQAASQATNPLYPTNDDIPVTGSQQLGVGGPQVPPPQGAVAPPVTGQPGNRPGANDDIPVTGQQQLGLGGPVVRPPIDLEGGSAKPGPLPSSDDIPVTGQPPIETPVPPGSSKPAHFPSNDDIPVTGQPQPIPEEGPSTPKPKVPYS
jgi:hypothetical protein